MSFKISKYSPLSSFLMVVMRSIEGSNVIYKQIPYGWYLGCFYLYSTRINFSGVALPGGSVCSECYYTNACLFSSRSTALDEHSPPLSGPHCTQAVTSWGVWTCFSLGLHTSPHLPAPGPGAASSFIHPFPWQCCLSRIVI